MKGAMVRWRRLIGICTPQVLDTNVSWYRLESTISPSAAYYTKSISDLRSVHVSTDTSQISLETCVGANSMVNANG